MATKKKEEVAISIPPIKVGLFTLGVRGKTSLMTERMSDANAASIEDAQQKKPKQAKGARDPKQEALDKLYHFEGGYGIKASAFKKSSVAACSFIDGFTKVVSRGSFYVMGDFVKIKSKKPVFRTDWGKLMGRTAVPIYRMEFKDWSVELLIRYNANKISPAEIANLLNTAGFHVGVGSWRPEKDGTFGMFEVEIKK